jgi:hypothetical protein
MAGLDAIDHVVVAADDGRVTATIASPDNTMSAVSPTIAAGRRRRAREPRL